MDMEKKRAEWIWKRKEPIIFDWDENGTELKRDGIEQHSLFYDNKIFWR